MKTKLEPSEPNPADKKSAEIVHFPRAKIVRVILKGNRVYSPPGGRYDYWDGPAA